jgi:hypothetical protein
MDIEKALRLAYQLGQTYWQQADSESYKENAKSDATALRFKDLLDSTSLEIRQQLAKPAVEWMPIKDAPKDGTAILVMIIDSDLVYTVAWREEAENSETKDGLGVGWRLTWDGYFFREHEYPTHWMPLPAAYDASNG